MTDRGPWVLLAALAIEIAIFGVIAERFLTVGNFFEVQIPTVSPRPLMKPSGIYVSILQAPNRLRSALGLRALLKSQNVSPVGVEDSRSMLVSNARTMRN